MADPNTMPEGLRDALIGALPAVINSEATALEGGTDPVFGTCQWRRLFCADRTGTTGLIAGVAEFGPRDTLNPHRHGPAELYFGLSGSGTVTIDGVAHAIGPGVAVYIPQEAEHGTVAGQDGLRFLYVFARDRFSEVDYRFEAAAPR